MSPRPYRAGVRRQAAAQATRVRIIEAARELLADPTTAAFSIDAIADRADVARMTVYYQFKSKGNLLAALLDDFGQRANMRDIQTAFREPDPARALALLIETFGNLWKTQGAFVRRLNAMAVLDVDVDRVLRDRGGWRRKALAGIVGRVHKGRTASEIIDMLYVLTSVDAYDMLTSARHSHKEAVTMLVRASATLLTVRERVRSARRR